MQRMKDLYKHAYRNLNAAIEAFEAEKSGSDSMLAARENFQGIIQIVDNAHVESNKMVSSSFA